MILLRQCLDCGFVLIIVKDDKKLIYYKALHSATVDNDYSELTKFFKECQKEYVKDIMNFAEDYAKDIKNFNPVCHNLS